MTREEEGETNYSTTLFPANSNTPDLLKLFGEGKKKLGTDFVLIN